MSEQSFERDFLDELRAAVAVCAPVRVDRRIPISDGEGDVVIAE